MLKSIALAQLRLGMYVHSIPGGWINHPFWRKSFKIETLEPGRVVCRMPIEGNTNHIGTMYAGALFTCAEFRNYDFAAMAAR